MLLPVWRRGTPPSTARVVVAGALAAGLVVSTAAIGHPVAGPWPWLAVAVTVVHVAAMAVWLGGLAGLLAAVLRPEVPADDVAAVVPRYSRIAFGAVAALVVSGTVQAVREVESPTALFVTTYGWVLVAKLVLVAVLLAAAGVSRVWVQQRLGVRRPRPGGRRSMTAHAFAASAPAEEPPAGVVAAAAARGHAQSESAAAHVPGAAAVGAGRGRRRRRRPGAVGRPGRHCRRRARPSPSRSTSLLPLQSASGPSGSVQVSVDPARPGANTLHVYLFDDTGRLTQPAGITVSLTEASQDIGPLDVELQPAGPGHYVADGMAIPGAGTWTLAVSVRLDEFTATTATTDFPVR